jgi:hypothetical protein
MERNLTPERRQRMERAVLERAIQAARAEAGAPKGACYLFSGGEYDCVGALTEGQCKAVADVSGLPYEWVQGESCD